MVWLVDGVVTVTGRGNKIKGAAASVGLDTTLTRFSQGMLIVSVSPRNGYSENLNLSVALVGGSVCSILVNSTSVGDTVHGIFGGLSVIPSGLVLTDLSTTVTGGSISPFSLLGASLLDLGGSCSCVVVSYPPSLKLLALGTLITTSSVVVPIRYSCFTLSTITRVLSDMSRIGSRGGPSLGVSKFLLAVCSSGCRLYGSVSCRVHSLFSSSAFRARVPEGVSIPSDGTGNRPIAVCGPSSGDTLTCFSLTGSIVSRSSQ